MKAQTGRLAGIVTGAGTLLCVAGRAWAQQVPVTVDVPAPVASGPLLPRTGLYIAGFVVFAVLLVVLGVLARRAGVALSSSHIRSVARKGHRS